MIVFRHTLEHLLDPIRALKTLAQCLSEDDFLYVAAPNFTKAQPKGGYRTDFLRPVHISYFTLNKLEWSLHLAGLMADRIQDEGEIGCIARKGKSAVELLDETTVNRAWFLYLLRTNRNRDTANILRILAYRLMVRYRLRSLLRVVRGRF